jgi:tetratricopeptide (TPR) repeat protein
MTKSAVDTQGSKEFFMPHPGTQELARRMQSVPRTSRGFQTLLPEVRALRTTLLGQNDKSGLIELAEKVRLWAPGEKAPAVTARALAEAADVLADAGQWERAAALLDRAVSANPLDIAVVDRAHTVLSRGKAFEELHDLLTQHAHLLDRKAPSEEAVRASSWQRVGKLRAEKLKNLDAAIAAYDTSMQILPEVNAVRELAVLLETRGRPEDRDGAADLYCLLGELLGGDEGAVYYARALNLNPQHPEALEQFGSPGPTPTPSPSQVRGSLPPAPMPPSQVRTMNREPAPADSRFAATVLQFPSPAPNPFAAGPSAPYGSSPSMPAPSPFAAPSPYAAPSGGLHAAASAASAALHHQGGQFAPAPAPMPMPAAAPYGDAGQPAPRHFAHVTNPTPSYAPPAPSDPYLQSAPVPTEITWSHEMRKARGPWRSALVIGVLAGVVAVGAVKRDELRGLATRTMVLVGLSTPKPAATSLDEVLGAARTADPATPTVTPATPTAAAPAAAEPAPAPTVTAMAPAAAPPPAADEPKKEEKAAPEEKKGGEVALVKGSLRNQGGKLPRSVLSDALDPVLARFEACYEKALGKSKKLKPEGTLQMSWVVKPSGSVDHVQKSGGTLKDASTITCVTKALKQADYPKPKGGAAKLKGTFSFTK